MIKEKRKGHKERDRRPALRFTKLKMPPQSLIVFFFSFEFEEALQTKLT
jgi:hypothetical protein